MVRFCPKVSLSASLTSSATAAMMQMQGATLQPWDPAFWTDRPLVSSMAPQSGRAHLWLFSWCSSTNLNPAYSHQATKHWGFQESQPFPKPHCMNPYQVTWIVADPKTGTVWVSRTDSQPCWIWCPSLEIDLCTLANGTLV